MIHRGQLGPDDFVVAEKAMPPVRLGHEALRATLLAWEQRLANPIRIGERTRTFREHVVDSAQRLAQVIAGKRADVDAFRLRW